MDFPVEQLSAHTGARIEVRRRAHGVQKENSPRIGQAEFSS